MDPHTIGDRSTAAAGADHAVQVPRGGHDLGHVVVSGRQGSECLAAAIVQAEVAQIAREVEAGAAVGVGLLDDGDRVGLLDIGEGADDRFTRVEVDPHAVADGVAVATGADHADQVPPIGHDLGHGVVVIGEQVAEHLSVVVVQAEAAQVAAEVEAGAAVGVGLLDDADRAALDVGEDAGDRSTRLEVDPHAVADGVAAAAAADHAVQVPTGGHGLGHVIVTGEQVAEHLAVAVVQAEAAQVAAEVEAGAALRLGLLDDGDRAALDVGEGACDRLAGLESEGGAAVGQIAAAVVVVTHDGGQVPACGHCLLRGIGTRLQVLYHDPLPVRYGSFGVTGEGEHIERAIRVGLLLDDDSTRQLFVVESAFDRLTGLELEGGGTRVHVAAAVAVTHDGGQVPACGHRLRRGVGSRLQAADHDLLAVRDDSGGMTDEGEVVGRAIGVGLLLDDDGARLLFDLHQVVLDLAIRGASCGR